MAMTKSNFEAVAAVLNKVAREHDLADQQCFTQVVIDLAAYFSEANPLFMPTRFFEAVYMNVPPTEGEGGGSGPVCNDDDHDANMAEFGACGTCGDALKDEDVTKSMWDMRDEYKATDRGWTCSACLRPVWSDFCAVSTNGRHVR